MSLRQLRQLHTRLSHAQRTGTTLSWPTAHAHSSLLIRQNLHGDAKSQRAQKHETPRHMARSYSNYAPNGPIQYYEAPPKSRGGRFKDMAIGSLVTVLVYVACMSYLTSKLEQEEEEEMKRMGLHPESAGIAQFYTELMKNAEAGSDGSAKSIDFIRGLFIETVAAYAYIKSLFLDDREILSLGPLAKFPEDHKFRGTEEVQDQDTAVFLPYISDEELKRLQDDCGEDETICQFVIVGVFANARDVDMGSYRDESTNLGQSKLNEILRRIGYAVEKMYDDGLLRPGIETRVSLCLRDRLLNYFHDGQSMRYEVLGGN
ncbi:hypothetical protein GGS21DRAFT_401614 [Xylaria nigripes]|nr:hypothetical protein GGS21DRAFT_401614 [Xylaria nigripes]